MFLYHKTILIIEIVYLLSGFVEILKLKSGTICSGLNVTR